MKSLRIQPVPKFSVKMYTRFRNFLSFLGVFEALSAKNFTTLATWLSQKKMILCIIWSISVDSKETYC